MPAEKRLANFLGWFSLGLGVSQVVMPGRVARMIGVRDGRDARTWMRVVGIAIGAVGGVLVVDALAAASLTRRSPSKAAITVSADAKLVRRSWLDLHGDDGIGTVRFMPAPAGRGTEIHVEAGIPGDVVKQELRRFKQLVEIGEEVRS